MERPLSNIKTAWIWTALALSAGGLFLVFNFTSEGITPAIFRRFSLPQVIILLAMLAAMWSVETLRIQVLLKSTGNTLPFREVLKVNLVTAFAGGVTPLAAAGPPTQVYLLYRRGVKTGDVLTVVTTRVLLNFLYFALVTPVIVLLFQQELGLTGYLRALVLAAAVLLLGLVAGIGYLLFHPHLILGTAERIFRWRFFKHLIKDPQKWQIELANQLDKFSRSTKKLISGGRPVVVLALALTALFWLFYFGFAPVMLRGLGVESPVPVTYLKQQVFYFLLSYVPLPGGSGVAELGFAALFRGIVPPEIIGAFVAGWRMLTYYLVVVAGALLALTVSRGQNRQVG